MAGLSATATTDKDGRFTWPSTVPVGSYRVTVAAAGFDTVVKQVPIQAGNNFGAFQLAPVNTYIASGTTLVYLPPGVSTFRGAFVVIYGGTSDSRPLLLGELAFYQNLPPSGDVTGYRAALRAFAREQGFAVVGMATPGGFGSATGATVAADILQGLLDASVASKHPELASAALLMQGMSTGACFVNKVVDEIPNRIIGFVSMKAGPGCGFVSGPAVASVPGYFFIGDLDSPSINLAVTSDFEFNRARGAVWAFATERGVGHVWVGNHSLIFNWAAEVAAQRLPATVTPGAPVVLRQVNESSGWLGDRGSFSIAEYRCFTGNKLAASWLPSEQTVHAWQSMMGSVRTVLACP